MNIPIEPVPEDLHQTCQRVFGALEKHQKKNVPTKYANLFKVYFDLGQTHITLADYYRLSVAAPLVLTNVRSELYMYQEPQNRLFLVCSAERGFLAEPEPAPDSIRLQNTSYEEDNFYALPIQAKYLVETMCEGQLLSRMDMKEQLLGVFLIRDAQTMSADEKFFLAKYAERISIGILNRFIYRQNMDRWKFIRTLIADIEHNVILPNMYFRHLFNRLKNKIDLIDAIRAEVQRDVNWAKEQGEPLLQCEQHALRLDQIHQELMNYHGQIVKHYNNMSLFIESLFRKEHFERGHLVLRPKRCFLEKEVIIPQLEQYLSRLAAANITIERPQNMYEEEFPLMVDIGLLAQVYANFFSNAAKYTEEVMDHHGQPRKAMAYGREIVHDFAGPGQKGIKCNVFTTGPSMTPEEGEQLYQEGVRGSLCDDTPGSGLGLSFIRHVIEMHGGKVGYEPTPMGNNFYFILPLPPLEYPLEIIPIV